MEITKKKLVIPTTPDVNTENLEMEVSESKEVDFNQILDFQDTETSVANRSDSEDENMDPVKEAAWFSSVPDTDFAPAHRGNVALKRIFEPPPEVKKEEKSLAQEVAERKAAAKAKLATMCLMNDDKLDTENEHERFVHKTEEKDQMKMEEEDKELRGNVVGVHEQEEEEEEMLEEEEQAVEEEIEVEEEEEEEKDEEEEIYLPPSESKSSGRKRKIFSLGNSEINAKRQKIAEDNPEEKYVGVYYCERKGNYRVQRIIDSKAYNGGTYNTKIEAARASDALVRKHIKFQDNPAAIQRLNFPDEIEINKSNQSKSKKVSNAKNKKKQPRQRLNYPLYHDSNGQRYKKCPICKQKFYNFISPYSEKCNELYVHYKQCKEAAEMENSDEDPPATPRRSGRKRRNSERLQNKKRQHITFQNLPKPTGTDSEESSDDDGHYAPRKLPERRKVKNWTLGKRKFSSAYKGVSSLQHGLFAATLSLPGGKRLSLGREFESEELAASALREKYNELLDDGVKLPSGGWGERRPGVTPSYQRREKEKHPELRRRSVSDVLASLPPPPKKKKVYQRDTSLDNISVKQERDLEDEVRQKQEQQQQHQEQQSQSQQPNRFNTFSPSPPAPSRSNSSDRNVSNNYYTRHDRQALNSDEFVVKLEPPTDWDLVNSYPPKLWNFVTNLARQRNDSKPLIQAASAFHQAHLDFVSLLDCDMDDLDDFKVPKWVLKTVLVQARALRDRHKRKSHKIH